jgi:site-specific recombinase XerC
LSAATRQRRLVVMRSFLRFRGREEWSPGDLGVTIDLPKLPRRLPKPLDAGELQRMTVDPVAGDDVDVAEMRDRALVAFLISTGCRISEAPGLDRSDWNNGSVIVRGKGDVERSVVITVRARTEVNAYLDVRDDDGPAFVPLLLPGGAAAVRPRRRSRLYPARPTQPGRKLQPHRFRDGCRASGQRSNDHRSVCSASAGNLAAVLTGKRRIHR